MKVIYTQTLENAIKIADFIGGISLNGNNYRNEEAVKVMPEIKAFAEKNSFISTKLNGEDAFCIWGDCLRECQKADYGYTQQDDEPEGFFPPELKFKEKEGTKTHVERTVAILQNKNNTQIYNASDLGNDDTAFSMLFKYAELEKYDKDIFNATIDEFTEAGIKRAFKNAEDSSLATRKILKDLTQKYIYFIANNNLDLILKGKIGYPKFKDLYVLKLITDKNDAIERADAQNRWIVNIQANMDTNSTITLKSTKTEFKTVDEAKEFIQQIPGTAKLTITEKEIDEYPPGPHSVASICEAAKKLYGTDPDSVKMSLQMLNASGYIRNHTSKVRRIPAIEEESIKEIIVNLAQDPTLFPPELKGKTKRPIEPKVISGNNKTGILVTSKPLSANISDLQKNLYNLIAKEMLKCILGPRKTKKLTASVTLKDIDFTLTGTKLIDEGYAKLEDPKKYNNPISEDFHDGDIVNISYIKEKITVNPPAPYKEQDLLKKLTAENSEVPYSESELRELFDRLCRQGILIRKGTNILPSHECCDIIHSLNGFEDLLTASRYWESRLGLILHPEAYQDNEVDQYSSNLMASAVDNIKKWISQADGAVGKQSEVPCVQCGALMLSNAYQLICPSCGYTFKRRHYEKDVPDDAFLFLTKHKTTSMLNGFRIDNESVFGRLYLTTDNQVEFTQDSTESCPCCDTNLRIMEGGNGYICPNCEYRLYRKYFGRKLSGPSIKMLLQNGKTPILTGLKKNGIEFNGFFYLDKNDGYKVKFVMVVDNEQQKEYFKETVGLSESD